MICANCKTSIADEARFCQSCGSLVSDAEGQAAASASMDQSSFRHMEQLLREETKGEFTIHHMIGRGGMAVVYLATETRLSRQVALKVLPPELTFGHGVARFIREARTAAALDHPNIIPIHRISSSEKLFWYAMKYLPGNSLEDLLRERGSLPLDECLAILEQVADALDYAHEHHVIHRDVKPANVMLDRRDRAIMTDFGIAKAINEGKLTATDSMIGTPYYMSPEQGMGKTVTGASDQYSVGVMAYRMLSGQLPFEGDSVIDILHKHCMFPAPRLRARNAPPHLAAAVARALSKAPHERFASVGELVAAMRDRAFVPTRVVRPSVVTERMEPADLQRLRDAGPSANQPAPVAAADPTKVVPRRSIRRTGAAPVAAAPASAPRRSRASWLLASLLVAGIVGWQGFARYGGTASVPANSDTTTRSQAPVVAPPTAPDSTALALKGPDTAATSPAPVPAASPPAAAAAQRPPATASRESGRAAERSDSRRVPDSAPITKAPERRAEPVAPPVTAPVSAPVSAPPVLPAENDTLTVIPSVAATIEIDGRSYGERGRLRELVPVGRHVVQVKKAGFITRTDTVEVRRGGATIVRITMERDP